MKLLSLFLSLVAVNFVQPAFADSTCDGYPKYFIYFYPAMRPDGSRFPAAEVHSLDGKDELLKCDEKYELCRGKLYRFERGWQKSSLFDAERVNLLSWLKCSEVEH